MDKGKLALARRHRSDIKKLLEALEEGNPFGEQLESSYEALKTAEEKALMCANALCLSLGDSPGRKNG